MKLGVFTVLLSAKSLEESLAYLKESGVQAVELGTGGYPGKAHVNPDELLGDSSAISRLKELVKKYDMEISALSCHGNPIHPQKEIASRFQEDFEKTILLAEKLGIERVCGFSGCPGDSPNSLYPNWVTCPWPDDFLQILDYQWNEVLIPYWQKMARFAQDHGVNKICFEMHPGFAVYNPESLLKLRNAVGDIIGANFDPSHLFWQGIEDVKHYSDEINRSWIFRTVGYGHDYQVWKDIVSTLRMIGYDYVLSIEHEDSLMSVNEGLQKAVKFLKEVLAFENTGEMWWA